MIRDGSPSSVRLRILPVVVFVRTYEPVMTANPSGLKNKETRDYNPFRDQGLKEKTVPYMTYLVLNRGISLSLR